MREPLSPPATGNCPTRSRPSSRGTWRPLRHRDQRRIGAAIDVMLGRRQVYANQCFGLHYPFLPADEFFDREHFPWLEELESHTDAIRAEVVALLASDDPGLSPYVTMPPGTPRNVWTDLNNSAAWSALHLWRDGERVEEACARAPKTATLVEKLPLANVPGRAPTVFFSILQAGKHIPPHTGVTNTRTIIHLPLSCRPAAPFASAAKRANGAKVKRSPSTTRSSTSLESQRPRSRGAHSRLLEPASQRARAGDDLPPLRGDRRRTRGTNRVAARTVPQLPHRANESERPPRRDCHSDFRSPDPQPTCSPTIDSIF